MGNALSIAGGTYSMEQLESEVGSMVDTLPRLQQSTFGPNVVELKGSGWFFNPKAPFDASLLRGKMTPQQYSSSVDRINKAHMERMVGKSRFYSKGDIPERRKWGKQAVEATIATLNMEVKGFRWDIQDGQATTTVTDIRHGKFVSTEHKQETSVLIVFDQD